MRTGKSDQKRLAKEEKGREKKRAMLDDVHKKYENFSLDHLHSVPDQEGEGREGKGIGKRGGGRVWCDNRVKRRKKKRRKGKRREKKEKEVKDRKG